jgi:hypothetical protein
MKAHFFDIDVLIKNESKVWIVDKTKPSIPIIKINQSEFNLIKKGVWLNNGQKIKIGGNDYWFSNEIGESLKIKVVKSNNSMSNLSFSMQEFMNPEILDKVKFQIFDINFEHLKNTGDDVYIICSKNTKRNSESIIKKLEENLSEKGIFVKKYYYITETFFNRDDDDISFKKNRLILQHLIGLKTKDNKFTSEEITKYDIIEYYDDSKRSLYDVENINDTLKLLLSNTEEDIKNVIKTRLNNSISVVVNKVNFNKVNKFISKTVKIGLERIIKTFESFKLRYSDIYSKF